MESSYFRFAISATFTAEPLETALRFWERQLTSRFDIHFAAYNQVQQTLAQFAINPAINGHGLNVVLARIEDLGAFDWDDPATLPRLRTNFHDLLAAVSDASRRSRVPVIFVLCPPSPEFIFSAERSALAAELETQVASITGVQIISQRQIEALYPVGQVASPTGDHLGRVPYTDLYFCALGTVLVRLADALHRPPLKVIALDCDNTLWKGICGEDGPTSVVLDQDSLALQRFMLRQHESGMLLTMASKNNEQDVLDTFAHNPQMPLRPYHFTARRVNWESKAANLVSLSSELSLSLDSLVFVDDNERETAEVEEELPDVLSLKLPETETERFLNQLWVFDHWSVTAEDRKRNALVAQVQEFGRELQQAGSLEHFLSTLDLRLTFGTATPENLPRIAQLTQRTNQFNFTTIRRTEPELNDGFECLTVEVADRFGEYGLTGVVLYRILGVELHIDTFLLSCRVLGRGVEHRLLAQVAREALKRGALTVVAHVVPTVKNKPAQDFLHSLGASRFNAAELAQLRWRPLQTAAPEPIAIQTPAHRRPPYQEIALRYGTAEQILKAIQADAPELPYNAALTASEQKLARIWAQLLGTRDITAESRFFDLGGHSLLMVQMVMRVRETFGIELAVDDVYYATLTLGDLARTIEGRGSGSNQDEYSALLSEIEALSDEEVARLLNEEQTSA